MPRSLPLLVLPTLLGALGCGSSGSGAIAPDPATTEDQSASQGASPTEQSAEARASEGTTPATVGQPAPNFTLTDQAGTEHTLATYRGKVVVLEWINPECPYVQRHYRAQTMQRLVEGFGDQIAWLAIDSSHFVTPDASESWRAEHELPYPILQDAPGDVGRLYGATTTPNMYVIDTEGALRYRGAIDDDPRGRGETPRNYVEQAVQALLDGGAPPVSETEPYGCTVKYES